MEHGAVIERIEVKGKKCMLVSGVDFGKPLVILKETDTHILCRKPGSMAWSGIGEQSYYGPEFIIFEKKGNGVKECLGSESFAYTREHKKEVEAEAFTAFERKESKNED